VISKENMNQALYLVREGDEETVSDDLEYITHRESSDQIMVENNEEVTACRCLITFFKNSAFAMSEVVKEVENIGGESASWADFSKAQFPSTSSESTDDTKIVE
jgi:hypothetical protein